MAGEHPCEKFLNAAQELKETVEEIMICEDSPPSTKTKVEFVHNCKELFNYIEKARKVLCEASGCSHDCQW